MIAIRISEKEKAELDECMRIEDRSQSELVRQLIREWCKKVRVDSGSNVGEASAEARREKEMGK